MESPTTARTEVQRVLYELALFLKTPASTRAVLVLVLVLLGVFRLEYQVLRLAAGAALGDKVEDRAETAVRVLQRHRGHKRLVEEPVRPRQKPLLCVHDGS